MKLLICNNDLNIIEQITDYLNSITELRKISFDISAYSCGKDVLDNNTKFDIAFVEMAHPCIDGLSVTKHLQNINPNVIIFIVASSYLYLDDAMGIGIFRYLSKPIEKDRFINNINAAIDRYQQTTQSIVVETTNKLYKLCTKDILYITIENRKACIITKEGKIRTQNNFEYWKQQINDYEYLVQPHNSYIVNLDNVISFSKTEITLSDNEKRCENIPISRRFYTSFKDAFLGYTGTAV